MIQIPNKPASQDTQCLSSLWHSASSEQLAIALWQLPGQTRKHLILDFSERPLQTKIDLEELPGGFAFSPFLNESGTQTLFLKADVHLSFDSDDILSREEVTQALALVVGDSAEKQSKKEAVISKLEQSHIRIDSPVSIRSQAFQEVDPDTERQHFLQMVEKAIEAIRRGDFQKVALSRSREVNLPTDFDVVRTFKKMCMNYPNAFVSLVSVPGFGVWMGASPEILISQDAEGTFRTVSLAGTQAAHPDTRVKEAHWTHKEIEEQALVSRYIVNCFKKIRLREYDEEGPKTVVAGNLMHLRTDFKVDTQAVGFPQLGTVMLELLHPTSAVCGMPKAAALDFILKNETHNRQFYSGYLGPVNLQQETHLFVNLRCMQLREHAAVLYAGAGVTAESVPEKEWLETNMKCQTMLQVLSSK
jgi:isochorismate synthase